MTTKSVRVFGKNSFEKAYHYAIYNLVSTPNDWGYFSHTAKWWRERDTPRVIVQGANRKYYVTNERTAAEMEKRHGWTRI